MNDTASSVPVYALYGEKSALPFADRLHWETLASRSSLHDFRISPHRHEQLFQVLQLTSGSAEVTLETDLRMVSAPAIIIVPALSVHAYRFDKDVEGTVLTLFQTDVRGMLDAHPETADALTSPSIISSADPAATEALDQLLQEADSTDGARGLALSGRVSTLLAALVRANRRALAASAPAPEPAVRHAQAFQRLVEKEFAHQRPLAFYAQALGITPGHLNRTANTVLGASAMAVVERRIMHEARHYLVFTTLPVKEVAYALGYTDPAYFSRAFSRVTGLPPERFRSTRTLDARAG